MKIIHLSILVIYLFTSCKSNKQNKNSKFYPDFSAATMYSMNTWKKATDKKVMKRRRVLTELDTAYAMIVKYPFELPDTLLNEISQNEKLIIFYKNEMQKPQILNEINRMNLNTKNIVLNHKPTIDSVKLNNESYTVFDSLGYSILEPKYSRNSLKLKDFKQIFKTKINTKKLNVVLNNKSLIFDEKGTAYVDSNIFTNNIKNRSLEDLRKVLIQEFAIVELIYFPTLNESNISKYLKALDSNRILVRDSNKKDAEYLQTSINIRDINIMKIPNSPKIELMPEFSNESLETHYLDALIFNDKVFVPMYNIHSDSGALLRWRELMPNHRIIGCYLKPEQTKWSLSNSIRDRSKVIYFNLN